MSRIKLGRTTAGEHDLHYWLDRDNGHLAVVCHKCRATATAELVALCAAREEPWAALQERLGTCEANVTVDGFGPPRP